MGIDEGPAIGVRMAKYNPQSTSSGVMQKHKCRSYSIWSKARLWITYYLDIKLGWSSDYFRMDPAMQWLQFSLLESDPLQSSRSKIRHKNGLNRNEIWDFGGQNNPTRFTRRACRCKLRNYLGKKISEKTIGLSAWQLPILSISRLDRPHKIYPPIDMMAEKSILIKRCWTQSIAEFIRSILLP